MLRLLENGWMIEDDRIENDRIENDIIENDVLENTMIENDLIEDDICSSPGQSLREALIEDDLASMDIELMGDLNGNDIIGNENGNGNGNENENRERGEILMNVQERNDEMNFIGESFSDYSSDSGSSSDSSLDSGSDSGSSSDSDLDSGSDSDSDDSDNESDNNNRNKEASKTGEVEDDDFLAPLLKQLLYPGCKLNLHETLLLLLQWQTNGKISQESFGQLLDVLSMILPEDHVLPNKLNQIYSILGINVDRYEKHVCVNDCHLFDDIPKSEYSGKSKELCPVCKEPRFELRGKTWSPRKKFYYIPLLKQIEMLQTLDEFNDSLLKMKDQITTVGVTELEGFWGGQLAKKYIEDPNFMANFSKHLVLSIGYDGVEPFKNSTSSVWPIGIKIWNLHPEERTSKEFVLLVVIAPGLCFFLFFFFVDSKKNKKQKKKQKIKDQMHLVFLTHTLNPY